MKKTKLTVWRVKLGDRNYSGECRMYLLSGPTAGAAESKAIEFAKSFDAELVKDEQKHDPYVESIELLGDLDEPNG